MTTIGPTWRAARVRRQGQRNEAGAASPTWQKHPRGVRSLHARSHQMWTLREPRPVVKDFASSCRHVRSVVGIALRGCQRAAGPSTTSVPTQRTPKGAHRAAEVCGHHALPAGTAANPSG